MQPNEQSKPKKNTARPLGRLGAFLLVTLAFAAITLRRDLGSWKRAPPRP